jgi:hypothetical protein
LVNIVLRKKRKNIKVILYAPNILRYNRITRINLALINLCQKNLQKNWLVFRLFQECSCYNRDYFANFNIWIVQAELFSLLSQKSKFLWIYKSFNNFILFETTSRLAYVNLSQFFVLYHPETYFMNILGISALSRLGSNYHTEIIAAAQEVTTSFPPKPSNIACWNRDNLR